MSYGVHILYSIDLCLGHSLSPDMVIEFWSLHIYLSTHVERVRNNVVVEAHLLLQVGHG